MQIGRYEIFTDEKEITQKNIIEVLQKAIAIHEKNRTRIEFLLEYEAGEQPILRNKTYRKDINCQCVDNVANEVTEFNLGFKWAFPITLVQRGNDANKAEAISWLNKFYDTQNIREKTLKLGRYLEICGIGYTYVDKAPTGSISPFRIETLDPMYTFVVRSNYYIDKRIVMGVVYRQDAEGNKHFTCFTDKLRFEIENLYEVKNGEKVEKAKWNECDRSGEINPL